MPQPDIEPFPSISTRLVVQIREEIISRKRAPGSHLKEPELAVEFGVSRGPVREALARLATEGLLTLSARRGATVVKFNSEDVTEIYSLRAALENLAVRRVFERYPQRIPALCDELEDIARNMPRQNPDKQRDHLHVLDYRFHKSICESAGHRRLLDSWLAIASQIRACIAIIEDFRPFDFEHEHIRLVANIRSGDAVTAASTIQEHIEQAGAVLYQEFRRLENDEEDEAS